MFQNIFDVFQGKNVRLGNGTHLVVTCQPMACMLYSWIEEKCPNFWFDVAEYLGHDNPKNTFAKHLAAVVSHVFGRSPFGIRPPQVVEKKGG